MKKLLGMRTLVALLCLVLVLAVFAACDSGAEGDETSGSETTGGASNVLTVTASGAAIITGSEDADVSAAATALVNAVKQYTGADIAVKTDAESAEVEILIGATTRQESESVLSELNGQKGYVVKTVGKKIVINATSTAMLDDAVNYFINNYVSSGKDGAFEVANDLCYIYGQAGGFSLLDADNKVQYKLIYSQDVDTTPAGENSTAINNGLDYLVSYIMDTWLDLESDFSISLPMDIDYSSAKDENLEILLGKTNRPETMTFLNTLKPNEYGYAVVGNKLVIGGWGDVTIGKAVRLFLDSYENFIVEENGVKNLVMEADTRVIESLKKWEVTVPTPDGVSMNAIVELINDAYELYYVDATPDLFRAYRTKLEGAGFELWQENQIGQNLFATYYSDKSMVHTYYVAYDNSIKVIVESMATAVLPQNEDPKMGEKITETSFTTFDSDEGVENWGNCFIITLEDGSFILHDGASNKKYNNQKYELEELYNLLKELNKREDGKIVIAAWVISHQHMDHFVNAYDVIMKYQNHKKNPILIERILINPAAPSVYYNGNNPNYYYENGSIQNVINNNQAGTELTIMHTGQTIQIRNLKLEVIYTTEDLYPEKIETFNNSTMVHRFTVGEGANAQSMTITGDIQDIASEIMCKMYSDGSIKTDILQIAHHGWGGTQALYALFAPTVAIWPKDQATVNELTNVSNTSYYAQINQALLNQKNLKLLVVSDDGHRTIMLPLLGITDNESANKNLVIVTPRFDGRP